MENLEKCDLCKNAFEEDKLNEVLNGDNICDDCLRSHFEECDDCGGYEKKSLLNSTANNNEVCDDCLSKNYSFCDYNQDYYPQDELVWSDHDSCHYHQEDAQYCDGFDDYLSPIADFESIGDKYYSLAFLRSHKNEEIRQCDDCGMWERYDYMTYSDYHGRDICENCLNEYTYSERHDSYVHNDEIAVDVIHSYNYEPELIFRPKFNKKNLYFGIEIETGCSSYSDFENCIEYLNSGFSSEEIFLKEDGSIGESHGVEIVSHPMTLENLKNIFPKTKLDKLISMGLRSYDASGCGIHVHISNHNMTDAHKIRLSYFFNICSDFLCILSQRNESHYAKYYKYDRKKFLSSKETRKTLIINEDRYEALNFKNNSTIEIRIFKGTLKHSTIMSILELCDCLYWYSFDKQSISCKPDQETLVSKFLRYTLRNEKKYPYLVQYLDRKMNKINNLLKRTV